MNEVLARALEMAVKVPPPNEGVSQMEKWEYKAFHVRNMNTGADMVNALREYGEQGWEHAVQLVPVTRPLQNRHAGTARGLIVMAADFDAPLADFDEYTS